MSRFYTAYERTPRVSYACEGESATVQDFARECDINEIVKRAKRTGTMPVPLWQGEMQFGVLPDETLQDVMNRQVDIKNYFDALPSGIRLRFGNNSMVFVEFMANESNWDEARKLGLLAPAPAEPAKAPDEPAAPAAGDPAAGQSAQPST